MKKSKEKNTGILYLVSTPIGNLKDITFRAVEVLKSVGIIAAEDTRHTRKLLTHYGIKKRLISYHDHNKKKSAPGIIKKLSEGEDVALVSDAGTPGISDPGYYLVNLAYKNDISVTACPGPCAAVMALSISGLPTDKFAFFGFLPTKPGKRNIFLKTLANENKSMVLYESSVRVEYLLKDLYDVLGDRYVVVARELTKIFEETIKGKLSEILKSGSLAKCKGELVVVVSAKDEKKKGYVSQKLDKVKDEVLDLLKCGAPMKEVSKQISDKYGVPKKEAYKFCLKLKD